LRAPQRRRIAQLPIQANPPRRPSRLHRLATTTLRHRRLRHPPQQSQLEWGAGPIEARRLSGGMVGRHYRFWPLTPCRSRSTTSLPSTTWPPVPIEVSCAVIGRRRLALCRPPAPLSNISRRGERSTG